MTLKYQKRIDAIEIQHILDKDTSKADETLGRYSDDKAGEHAIDRQHALDCPINTGETKLVCDRCKEPPPITCIITDQNLATEDDCTTHDHEDDAVVGGKCQHPGCGNGVYAMIPVCWHEGGRFCNPEYNYGEYRYFVPSDQGEDTPENIRKYAINNYKRVEALNDGVWHFIGVQAVAKVATTARGQQHWTMNTLETGGVWSVESDSSADYLKDLAAEELEELRSILRAHGYGRSVIAAAFKNVITRTI